VAQQLQRHEFNSEKAEIEASALWARQRLLQQPQTSIAIVVPKLAQLRDTIEQVFTRVFEPQYIFPQQAQHASGFNISAGQRFESLPLVAAALQALTCNASLLDIEDVSRLLRSPFIGRQEELDERALLDAELRDTDIRISLRQLIEAAAAPMPAQEAAQPANGSQQDETAASNEAEHDQAPPEIKRRCPTLFMAPSLPVFKVLAAANQLPGANP